ncbi:acyl carrier protein [Rhodococcoides corynebacterioides]|uniref:acyl carrier protein n=1 Tax=Rhodococcoides corynebacterioides TaxID=53972 RepID=UPI0027E20B61|nr:acyl carrier protein [Rhodococcus corynebacterioides]
MTQSAPAPNDAPAASHDHLVRSSLQRAGRLPVDAWTLADTDDLFDAGLTSHASVALLVDLEDAIGVEFPDALLRKSTFSSIATIRAALARVQEGRGGLDTSAVAVPGSRR